MASLSCHLRHPGLCGTHDRGLWKLCIGVGAASVLVFLAPRKLQAQPSAGAGYVLSINGNWRSTSSSKNLIQFQSLPGGAKVFASKPITKESFITIALFNGETIQRRCQKGACGAPIKIPSITPQPLVTKPAP